MRPAYANRVSTVPKLPDTPETCSLEFVPADNPAERDLPLAPTVRHVAGILFATIVPLVGLAAAVWYAAAEGRFRVFDAVLLIGGTWLGGQGITLGYHRLLTHRAFEADRWLRNVLTAVGALTVQKSPLDWCAAHRKHHEFSDKPGDPHSPHVHGDGEHRGVWSGLWYAHVGWLFTGHIMTPDLKRYVPDLLKDRFAMAVHRTWDYFWVPLAFLIPAGLGALWYGITAGGWGDGALRGFLWGGCGRIFLTHHLTWSVNSICHLWGGREFASRDASRNNVVCALVTSGEGWHNNHHAFPTSARLGLRWWQFDSGWVLLRFFERAGWVRNVTVPTPEQMNRRKVAAETSTA